MSGGDMNFRLPPIVRAKEPIRASDANSVRDALGQLHRMVLARTPQPSPDIGHRYGPGGVSFFLKQKRGGGGKLRFVPAVSGMKLFIGDGCVCSFLMEDNGGRKTPHRPKIGNVRINHDPAPYFNLEEECEPNTAYVVVLRVDGSDSKLEIVEEDESDPGEEDVLLEMTSFSTNDEGKPVNLQQLWFSDVLLPSPTGDVESSSSGSDDSSSSGDDGDGSGSSDSESSSSDPTPDCDFDFTPPDWEWCTTNPTSVSCPPDPLKRTSPVRCIEWETLVPEEYREVGCINFYLSIRITGGWFMIGNEPADDTAARNEPIEDRAIIELKGMVLPDQGACSFQQRIFTECTYHDVIFEVFSEYDDGFSSEDPPPPAHPCCGLLYRGKFRFQNPPCNNHTCTPGVVVIPP